MTRTETVDSGSDIVKTRLKPTYANVTSTLALVVALSGGAYAATSIPNHSVGTAQLKPDAVTGGKVKNGSLRANDFNANSLPSGEPGPAGPSGAPGAQGQQGLPGDQGEQGVPGQQGEQGEQGQQGVPGQQGEQGEQGQQGEQGIPGQPGKDGTNSVVEIRRMKGDVDGVTQIHDPSYPQPDSPNVEFFGPTKTFTVTTGQILTASARVDMYTRTMSQTGLYVEICQELVGNSHPYYPDGTGEPAPSAVGAHTSVTPVVAWYMTAGTYKVGVCGVSGSFDDDFDLHWTGYIQVTNSTQTGL
jgi:hypothetical protein